MAVMWTMIAKNNSGSTHAIDDLGLELANGTQVTISDQFRYEEIAGSDDLRTLVAADSITLNDGTSDLSVDDGVDFLAIVHIYYLKDYYFDKTQLSTGGQSTVHWDNITNAPAFGALTWRAPVLYRVTAVASGKPGSPALNDFAVDTDDNHIYQWNGATWDDLGVAATDDRIIDVSDPNESVASFNGATWDYDPLGAPQDDWAIMVDNDGDGKTAQYVYEATSNEWVKIADVDWSGHFDGGANKHDASEIDVEGDYTNITTAPTDLETIINEIDSLLTSALAHNTLDSAYDEGGAGAGRVITADSGAVKIDTGAATNAPLEIAPKANLPTTGLADGQIAMKDGIMYMYDGTRTKWLSVHRETFAFGKDGPSKNVYMRLFGGRISSNNSGIRMYRNATVVAMSCQLKASGTGNLHLRKNDGSSDIATLAITATNGAHTTSTDLNIAAGDFLQAYVGASVAIDDPLFTIEVAWRP